MWKDAGWCGRSLNPNKHVLPRLTGLLGVRLRGCDVRGLIDKARKLCTPGLDDARHYAA